MRQINEETKEMCLVSYNGKPKSYVSPFLLNRQDVWHNLEEIKELHWLRYVFFELIEETDNKDTLKELAKDLVEIELKLQELWKFNQDTNYYRFWYVPKCTCPKMDNDDNYPYGRYVINKECPLHGS